MCTWILENIVPPHPRSRRGQESRMRRCPRTWPPAPPREPRTPTSSPPSKTTTRSAAGSSTCSHGKSPSVKFSNSFSIHFPLLDRNCSNKTESLTVILCTYRRRVDLSHWLAHWIRKGAVPIATLNLQKGVTKGQTVPDAWHHQVRPLYTCYRFLSLVGNVVPPLSPLPVPPIIRFLHGPIRA